MRLRLPLALAVIVAAAAHVALAAPPPRIRIGPASPEVLLEPARIEHASTPADVCGTRVEAIGDLVAEHAARALNTPLPTPHSTDVGEIAVLEDDGNFFYSSKGGDPLVDLASVGRAFFRTHGDDYDFLAIYLSSGLNAYLGSPTALAAAYPIRNAIQGIGLDAFDFGAEFGSAARLQTVMSMNGLHRYPADPDSNIGGDTFSTMDVFLHEFGHRWLAYTFVDSAGTPSAALLGRAHQHWSFFFDSDSSLMEGCDWARPAADSFRTDGVSNGFGMLDLYLMGLRSKAETDSFFVVENPTNFDPPGIYIPITSPFVGLGCHGTAQFFHVGDIETQNGVRVPDATTAPHTFRVAVALLTSRGNDATAADLAQLESIRTRMGPYFAAGTHGYGALDATLDSHAGQVAITHAPLADTENGAAPRPIGARVAIAQAGIPIALDASSVQAFWRGPGGGSFTAIPLASVAADSFAALLPALPGGGTAEYYLHAASDSAGIDAFDPPAGPLAPHTYVVGPDATPPVIAHVPVHAQSAALMPQTVLARVTDNLGVDSVWIERSVDGGATTAIPVAVAGRDSFSASLGAGLTAGHRVAYRFVARDAAAAHNVAVSNAAFDTLVVGTNWLDDGENGADGWTHQLYWYSYRDAWHLSQESSSPAGGTSWKCGATEAIPYPPHLDANLYTPVIATVVPGTILQFDHRWGAEEGSPTRAWDGLRLEIQQGAGPFVVLQPIGGYSHSFISNSHPFERDTPCWSGNSGGWRTTSVDLSPYAPGPVRVRFRFLADENTGDEGWFVDHVLLSFGGTTAVPLSPSALSIGTPWPNPARGALHLALSSPRAHTVAWELFDVAGRRVASLWRGRIEPGARELEARLPELAGGLYFARLTLDGRESVSRRVVVLR
jgi:hypothetical protein